jgi:hypothetical protein
MFFFRNVILRTSVGILAVYCVTCKLFISVHSALVFSSVAAVMFQVSHEVSQPVSPILKYLYRHVKGDFIVTC